MNPDDVNDEDLSLLTDEERAGMEDDDEGDDAADDAGDDGAEDEEDAGADDEGDEEDGAADDSGDADGADDAGDAADDAAGRDDGDDDDAASSPRPSGDRVDPTEVQTKLDEIAKQKTDLEKQLDEGEITTKEYVAALDKLNDDKGELTGKLARQQEQDEAVTKAWYGDVNKFLAKHKDVSANDTRLQSFDSVVRRVTADPANSSLSNRKQLEKAHALWKEEMGISETTESKPKAKPAAGKEATKPKPTKRELPPTLHNLPAADLQVGDDGKFSYLDALLNSGKTVEYEDQLGRLSEADQQDYLSRA
jgi:hypothetical protein